MTTNSWPASPVWSAAPRAAPGAHRPQTCRCSNSRSGSRRQARIAASGEITAIRHKLGRETWLDGHWPPIFQATSARPADKTWEHAMKIVLSALALTLAVPAAVQAAPAFEITSSVAARHGGLDLN